jgi:hypothetical protein
MFKFLTTLILCCCFSSLYAQKDLGKAAIYHGTTIIVIATLDTIWVAADTKEVLYSDSLSSKKSTKIFSEENIFYTFCGAPSVNFSNKILVNAPATMKNCIKKNKKFDDVYNYFIDSATHCFSNFYDSLYKHKNEFDNAAILQKYKDSPLLKCIMFSFINEKPVIKGSIFTFNNKLNGNKIIVDTANIEVYKDTTYIFEGYTNNILNYLKKNKDYFSGGNMKEKLIYLIGLEAKKNPEFVSLPVDLVVIYRKGYKWYYNENR